MNNIFLSSTIDAQDIKTILLKHLPSYTKAFSSKEEFASNFTFEQSKEIIDTAKFIRFNTKKFTNILIFDIDAFPSFDFKPSLSQMHDHFYNLTGFEPSWTLKTSKGYHIGLLLDKGVFNTWKDNKTTTPQYQALITLKKNISNLIDADQNASNRSYGIWRNPITHENIFTGKEYSLEDLLLEFNIPLQKPKPKLRTGQLITNQANLTMKTNPDNKILAAIDEGFYIGNRNKYLFAYGYKLLFENRSLENNLEHLIHLENNHYANPLTSKEVKDITSSILKFLPTMYKSTTMKQRGKLSNLLWKLNIHGTSQRRSFAGWHTSKERHKKTLSKITKTMLDAFEKGKSLTQNELAKKLNCSKKTIQRYEQTYNLSTLVFNLWQKALTRRANSEKSLHKIDIRPFVLQEVTHKLRKTIDEFLPSPETLFADLAKKRLYLRSIYPLSA